MHSKMILKRSNMLILLKKCSKKLMVSIKNKNLMIENID